MTNMEYERLIQIINQDNITSQEVTEAIELLVSLNIYELKKEDYKVIEEFIINSIIAKQTQKEFDTLTHIINFIRGEE